MTIYRGESITVQKGAACATSWIDKKVVNVMASCCSDPAKKTEVKRRLKDGSRVAVPCPEAVSIYNQYMQGDQLRGYYKTRTRCRKFYKYIYWFLFDVAIINSYALYKNYRTNDTAGTLSLKLYRLKLADQMIGSYNSRKGPGRTAAIVAPNPRTSLIHVPVKKKQDEKTRRGPCFLYAKSNIRKDTSWQCKGCLVWLCFDGSECECYIPNTYEMYVHCILFTHIYILVHMNIYIVLLTNGKELSQCITAKHSPRHPSAHP